MNNKLTLGAATLAALSFVSTLSAAPYNLTPIDGGPGAEAVLPSGLNDQGVVVGEATMTDTSDLVKSRASRGRQMLRDKVLECCHVELAGNGEMVDYRKRECLDGPGCGKQTKAP